MIPFAAKLKDDAEKRGRWVLAVEGERFLMVAPDNSFEWVPMADCEFFKAATPDQPLAVMTVHPEPKIALPTLNGKRRV